MKNMPIRLINIVAFLQQRYMLPIVFLFYLHNGLTIGDFIFFQSIFYMVSLVAEIPTGYIADMFSRKKIMLLASFLYIFRLLCWIFAKGYWPVLMGEIFFGLSKSFSHGVADSYIYDYLQNKNETQKMLKRFGKYNFYLCLASAIGGILGAYIYQEFDSFRLLLMIELILNIVSVLLILALPDIACVKIDKAMSFSVHVKAFFNAFKTVVYNNNICVFIIYSAILTGISNLFAWNFQPMMKAVQIPIILFGVLHFINHTLRGTFSLFSKKIIKLIPYKSLGILTGILHAVSFVILYFNQMFLNQSACFISLILICISIGFQMAYYCATIAHLHHEVLPAQHATSSSVLTMFATLFSSALLYAFKEISAIFGLSMAFIIFAFIFALLAFFCNYKIKSRQI